MTASDQQVRFGNSPDETAGGDPNMRMTREGAQDLFAVISHARRDWSSTNCWAVVSKLLHDYPGWSYAEMVCAAAAVMANPLVGSPEAILEDGRHWDNVRSYLAGSSQGRRYADVHSGNVLEQLRNDLKNRPATTGAPSRGYLAASAALAATRGR